MISGVTVADFTVKGEKSLHRHDLKQLLLHIFPYAVHHNVLKIRYIFFYTSILKVVGCAFSQ
ncbi:hypothetical protein A0E43_05375 [Pectobacterium cacticida]